LPNILRLFNPHIVGYSTGDSTTVDKESGFNVGEAGALSYQMPYQARVLVERIKRDRRVDFQRDWKVCVHAAGGGMRVYHLFLFLSISVGVFDDWQQ
jgi:hypothetical protein